MSIRFRLTVWYSALLGAMLLLFSFGLYSFLTNAILADVSNTLKGQGEQAAAVIELELDPMAAVRRDDTSLLPRVVFATQVYAQVLTPDGVIYQRSPNLKNMDQILPISQEMLDRNLKGQSGYYTLRQQGTPIHVYSMPIHHTNGDIVGVLQIGQSLVDMQNMLGRVRTALYLISVLGIIGTALGGALLARSALRPIDDITATARRIGRTENLAERIAIPDSGDEVSRLAETFNEMLTRLDHLFQTQQRLVGDVSHELRTPLTTIQGNLDLLKRGAIEDAELRQEALADAGHVLNRAPVELDTLLLDVFRQGVMMAQGQVELRLGHEDQAQIMGDVDRLRQLLLNLIDNAIKYTPAGGMITLALYRESAQVRIEVTDTGIGIAENDLPHIFERFFRADRARSRRLGGTGLGLSIVHWVAQAHGGDIEVRSELGKGSTFTLRLPLADGLPRSR